MKKITAATAALLLAATSTASMAQTIFLVPAPGEQKQQNGAADRNAASQSNASRSEQRSALRGQMAREGFQNIRISDAMFVVQATTPDGRDVLMVVKRTNQGQNVSSSESGDEDAYSYSANAQAAPDFQGGPATTAQPGQGLTAYGRTPSSDAITGAVQAGSISEDQVRSQLQARGFQNLRDWQQEDGNYTATADWYGQEVDVRVDAQTGEVLQPTTLEDAQVKTLLGNQGFSNVRSISRQGDMITAQADRNGTTLKIQIDPRQAEIEDRTRQESGSESQGG